MENSRWDPNAEIVCPYDSTHVVAVKRFQRHLVKCRQNHPDKDFVTCPFNARHMFLRSDLRKHLAHCADRVTLDADVMQEEDPETGETLRLKGKTDMPKAPENIPNSTEDWDDEIEENLAVKYAEQEEYLRLQGIIAKKTEEEPLLRRPTFPIVNKPNLPVLNKPVHFTDGQLTSLRRPNLLTVEKTKSDSITSMASPISIHSHKPVVAGGSCNHDSKDSITFDSQKTESRNHRDPMESTCYDNQNEMTKCRPTDATNLHNGVCHSNTQNKHGIVPMVTNKTIPRSDNNVWVKDLDNESMISDSSWTSSVYEPINRYSNKSFIHPNPVDYDKDTIRITDAPSNSNDMVSQDVHKSSDMGDPKTMQGVAKGNFFRSVEGSAFTAVVPKQTIGDAIKSTTGLGRGLMNGHTTLSNIDERPKKVLGRGSLKLAAINFQTS